jgi:hypothetical protein
MCCAPTKALPLLLLLQVLLLLPNKGLQGVQQGDMLLRKHSRHLWGSRC